MSEAVSADRMAVERVIAASAVDDAFWKAAPHWLDDAAWHELDGELLVWTRSGLVTVSAVATLLAVHLDGQVTLAELAEDLAAVADLPLPDARGIVASMAVELQSWDAIGGVPVAEVAPDEPEGGCSAADGHEHLEETGTQEFQRPDPVTGEELRVKVEVIDGNRVTTEYLPDGSRRVTSEMVFGSEPGQSEEAAAAAEALAAALLDGDRSVAELVPTNSCLGSKLRNHDDVPLLSFRCADGKVRSVRCHDPEVARLLVDRGGERIVPGEERGAVEVFVVTPLEGVGPLRIYDGRGARRGRPRSAAEAVDVVDQLLGEATTRRRSGADAPLPLSAGMVHRAEHGVLVDLGSLARPGASHRLGAAGWTVTGAFVELDERGDVAVPSAFGTGATFPATEVSFVVSPEMRPVELATALVGSTAAGPPAGVALDRLAGLVTRSGTGDGSGRTSAAEVRRIIDDA